MAIKVITDFIDIATVRIRGYIKDDDGALVDPTSVVIDIYDPDSTLKIDGSAMTKESTGVYEYYYHKDTSADPMDSGNWRGVIKAIDGSGADAIISPATFGFRVL
jgi:hypothetical protein